MYISRDSANSSFVYAAQAVDDTSILGNGTQDKEYWVSRVVRQMKGCSPSQIDSVIQANMPKREIRWSQRPDTLEIPGLKGRQIGSWAPMEWDGSPSFFSGNELYHPELHVHRFGIMPKPLDDHHTHHDFTVGMAMLCFAMLAVLINSTRSFIHTRAKDFFFDDSSKASSVHDKDALPIGNVLLSYLLLSIVGSLFVFQYVGHTLDLFLCSISQYALMSMYVGCFVLMFVFKGLLAGFINWIFFDIGSRRLWRRDYNFLLVSETALLLPVAAAGICFDLPAPQTLFAGLCVAVAFKILLLYKTYVIFLPNLYCFLHLLSYLCALEIMPFLALWAILHEITGYLIITF